MKIRRASWTTFRLPFRRPFATAHGTLAAREGVILRLTTAEGLAGLGEASAVPGFGGSLADVLEALSAVARRLVGRSLAEADEIVDELDVAHPGRAAAAFAVDTAVFDLRAQAAGLPVTCLLGGDPGRAVPVNATVGAPSTAEAVQSARAAAAAGYPCVKLKVGVARSESDEIARIEAVRAAIGTATGLRIDANGAWDVEQAIRMLRAIEPLALEYVEQPVAADDLAGMARVRAAVATPVAADESVGGLDQVRRAIAAGAADVLVIKPMLLGRLQHVHAAAALARAAGAGVVITTTLDSGVGVAAALHLAAALPAPLRACGLATGPLLVDDLVAEPLAVEAGVMRVPRSAGLGVRVDEGRLATYRQATWEFER